MAWVHECPLDPAQFDDGVRCAQCGTLLVEVWGHPVAPLWERRAYAVPLWMAPPDEDADDEPVDHEAVGWVWEVICAECADA